MPAAAEAVLTVPYYVTDKGLLINLKTDRPERHRINDAALVPTFNPRWWLVEGQTGLLSCSEHGGVRQVNQRYVLINSAVQGPPSIIPAEAIKKDCDYDWTGEYAGLQSLYRYEYDVEDLGFLPQPFQGRNLGSVKLEDLGDPTSFSYQLHGTGFMSERKSATETITYKDIFKDYLWADDRIAVDEIAKAMTPDIAWHLYPCAISSELAYRIVRSWVKDHIDPLYAVVTSDYDFCFTVEKKIRVAPFVRKIEQYTNRFKSYNPPRFTNSTVQFEKRKVFEMTSGKDRYKDYPVVNGFKGDSLADLAAKIDQYLHDLMEVINAPLTKCQHCGGLGVIDYYKLPTNERDALKMKTHVA